MSIHSKPFTPQTLADSSLFYPGLPAFLSTPLPQLRSIPRIAPRTEEYSLAILRLTGLEKDLRLIKDEEDPSLRSIDRILEDTHLNKRAQQIVTQVRDYTINAASVAPIRRLEPADRCDNEGEQGKGGKGELLIRIFSHFLGPEDVTTQTPWKLFELMGVCSTWRNLIISTPSFWQKITLIGRESQSAFTASELFPSWMDHVIHTFLENSKDSPLDVTVSIRYPRSGPGKADHQELFRSMPVMLTFMQLMRIQYMRLAGNAALACLVEACRILRLSLSDDPVVENGKGKGKGKAKAKNSAPRVAVSSLEYLDLRDVDGGDHVTHSIKELASHLYLGHLRTLQLGPYFAVQAADYAALVASTPNVTQLTFLSDVYNVYSVRSSSVSHPKLEHLVFGCFDEAEVTVSLWLSRLIRESTKLTSLSISTEANGDFRVWGEEVSEYLKPQMFKSVKYLELVLRDFTYFTDVLEVEHLLDMCGFLEMFTKLEALSIGFGCKGEIGEIPFYTTSDFCQSIFDPIKFCMPNLVYLRLINCPIDVSEDSELPSLIEALCVNATRINRNKPARIDLHHCLVQSSDADSGLGRLRSWNQLDEIAVENMAVLACKRYPRFKLVTNYFSGEGGYDTPEAEEKLEEKAGSGDKNDN